MNACGCARCVITSRDVSAPDDGGVVGVDALLDHTWHYGRCVVSPAYSAPGLAAALSALASSSSCTCTNSLCTVSATPYCSSSSRHRPDHLILQKPAPCAVTADIAENRVEGYVSLASFISPAVGGGNMSCSPTAQAGRPDLMKNLFNRHDGTNSSKCRDQKERRSSSLMTPAARDPISRFYARYLAVH